MNEPTMAGVIPWLILHHTPGVGSILFGRLLARFKSPDAVLGSSFQSLKQVEGVTDKVARAILDESNYIWARKQADCAERAGYLIVTRSDERYPALLLQIHDPPPLLYVNGRAPHFDHTIAIVGARQATAYGHSAARELAGALAQRGVTVISGMALGIDSAAHLGALDGGGSTVAVLGSGLNCIYPPQNMQLSRRITAQGCLISELELDAQPEPHHFPMRNRIISGMSLGTVVVEAAQRSGSLITARLALEQNREVFAVPGHIHARTTQGTHDLIKQGAKLVGSVEDILVEIWPQLMNEKQAAVRQDLDLERDVTLTTEEKQVLGMLEPYPVHIDVLVRSRNLPIGRLIGILSQLELKGFVCQEPGKYFSLNANTKTKFKSLL